MTKAERGYVERKGCFNCSDCAILYREISEPDTSVLSRSDNDGTDKQRPFTLPSNQPTDCC
ncbi:hypothetical protein LCGC14_2023600 [marine sediment metagenome]|uniref:Uncharacterized protein n=1 Tax=marine sediment metagenome TaxID=412755 RepID=A0A0F9HTU7_9ZZZZ